MKKRLFIDMTQCDACEKCTVECAYFYRPHAADHGVLKLQELASFLVFCRRCENPTCVAACRFDAIERQEDGVMKRYNLRCVSCKCCSHACPFGTILPDTLAFYVTACDYCMRLDGKTPPCVSTCVQHAIEYKEVEESEEDGVYIVNDNFAVKTLKWEKKAV